MRKPPKTLKIIGLAKKEEGNFTQVGKEVERLSKSDLKRNKELGEMGEERLKKEDYPDPVNFNAYFNLSLIPCG